MEREPPREAPAFDLVVPPLVGLLVDLPLLEAPPFEPLVERRPAVGFPEVELPRVDPPRAEPPRVEPAAPREEDARVPVLAFEAIRTD